MHINLKSNVQIRFFFSISGFLFPLFETHFKNDQQNNILSNVFTMIRMAGSKLLARLLLLISSITLISLLALARCGIGGLVDNNLLLTDDGKMILKTRFYRLIFLPFLDLFFFLCIYFEMPFAL